MKNQKMHKLFQGLKALYRIASNGLLVAAVIGLLTQISAINGPHEVLPTMAKALLAMGYVSFWLWDRGYVSFS